MADVDRKKVTDKGGKLFTMAVDRSNGEILWEENKPPAPLRTLPATNSSASPAPPSTAKTSTSSSATSA